MKDCRLASTLDMKRASYREAIDWIVYNDRPDDEHSTGHITSCLVADLFQIPVTKVLSDVFKLIAKLD